jgi:protein SCO1
VRWCGGQIGCVLVAVLWLAMASPGAAQVLMRELPGPAQEVDLKQLLGERIPLDLEFIASSGEVVRLEKYFNQGKPVILVMVYYNCPLICPLTLERLQHVLNGLRYTVGNEFNVVVISFDTRNTTAMAAENKAAYLAGYNRPKTPEVLAGWEFHTSTAQSARRLAEAIGFSYKFIPETGEYSHPSTFVVLTDDGVISRYTSGLDPDVREMRLALLEASQGQIAQSISDFFLHLCFRWDPTMGAYSLHAMRVMQITGLLCVLGLATLIAALKAGERARRMWGGLPARTSEGEPVGAGPVAGNGEGRARDEHAASGPGSRRLGACATMGSMR